MSVSTGTRYVSATLRRIRAPSFTPGPRKLLSEVRLALSYEALKIYGTRSSRVTALIASAILRACVSLSITHGPAMRKSSPDPTCTLPISNSVVAFAIPNAVRNPYQFRRSVGNDKKSSALASEIILLHFNLVCATLASILVRRLDEFAEERMRLEWLRLEFRVELAAEEVRMVRNLKDLDVSSVRRGSGNAKSSAGEQRFVLAIEFVAMTMTLADLRLAIGARG